MEVGEIRYYKGLAPVVVEVVGRGVGNVGVRFLEDFSRWKRGERIVTRPRLFFRIANERVEEELISGLHRGLHIVDSKEKISFVNYYSFYHNGRIPEEYQITIFKDKLLGEVSSTESGEVYSYEDWQNLLWDLNGKKAIVLHAFKRVCYEAHGQIDPIMHWKLIRKPMQLIFLRRKVKAENEFSDV
ncbi:MAG: hypothetical protein QXR76_03365 [Candidatus Bathyarchaeia archaeon]